jgi:N-acetylglucosamine-6-phosphate deacetylase
MPLHSLTGAAVFDGHVLHQDVALVLDGGRVAGIGTPQGDVTVLDGGIVAPGFLDLQVNGGGGLAVGGDTDAAALAAICAVHARLGATGILPTLITDTPAATARVIAAGIAAARADHPGFLGLHIEGPHLDPRRKGAHDPALIRPMEDSDLDQLLQAAAALPALMVTLAPEAANPQQIAALAGAGVIVSLGHSDCTAAQAQAAMQAGAACATHLFNAMSQLGNREPGLAGTVLGGGAYAGLIADGIHVDPLTMRVALAAKPEGVFLVSDCMALAGTDRDEMVLGGRRILRGGGRLTLEDGTLAGADLTLPRAVQVLVEQVSVPVERALAMATRIPAQVLRRADIGRLTPGARADVVHLRDDLSLARVWQGGGPLAA